MGGLGPPRPGPLAIRGLVTAVRFLTIIPVPGRALEGPDALGRAAGWFPLVGLALGGLLALEDLLLSFVFPPFLSVLFVLVTWKLLTGGIHLDGLADSLDGLTGKNPAERLTIMSDSRIGVFGALGLMVVLLVSLTSLTEVSPAVRARGLLLAPAVGRLMPLLLARVFSPATPREGSGAAFMGAATRGALGVGLGVVALASAMIAGKWGLVVAAAGLALAGAAARFLSRRLGGLTGDSLGAAVEVGELGVLLAFAALSHLRFV